MKVLIFGATGSTGHEIVKRALEQGHHVTAYARNPTKLTIASIRLAVVQGNLNDEEQLSKAIKGQDAVISALGSTSMFRYEVEVVRGIKSIVKIMERENINRFIYLSFAGVKESRDRVGLVIRYLAPKLLATEIARHEDAEKIIKQSRLSWTIVRPPTLTNGEPSGHFTTGEDISKTGIIVSISRADVADFIVRRITDQAFVRMTPLILS